MSQSVGRDNLLESLENKENKHFIDNELFEEILAMREYVYKETEINVSRRKIVNLLIKQSDFILLRDQLIKKYS